LPDVTLRDVAQVAGVHPSTASRALDPARAWLVNTQTRERVVAAARDLGYQPDVVASSLRTGRTDTIGLVVADLANPYVAPVVRGIENALEGRGLMPMIAETQDDQARASRVFDHLMRRRVDAIITTATRANDRTVLKKVARRVPLVLAVRPLAGSGFAMITNDDHLGARLAARHLADLGHRRVAQLVGPLDVGNFGMRKEAYEATAAEAGIDVLEIPETATTPTLAEGRRLMLALLARHPRLPTAVFAHNDLMALGALTVLADYDMRCPDDISLVGYNDTTTAAFTNPPLTTVSLPGYELGRLAAEMAVTLIEQPANTPTQLSLPPSLVIRGSTAPPRRDGADATIGQRIGL
jgi:LacI family transcriptional regulator